MKFILTIVLAFLCTTRTNSQVDSVVVPEQTVLDLQFHVIEALMNNPEILSAQDRMDEAEASVTQASALDEPFERRIAEPYRFQEIFIN